jgi:hypothetical protein
LLQGSNFDKQEVYSGNVAPVRVENRSTFLSVIKDSGEYVPGGFAKTRESIKTSSGAELTVYRIYDSSGLLKSPSAKPWDDPLTEPDTQGLLEPLKLALRDKSKSVQERAARALGESKSKDSFNTLTEALDDKMKSVRAIALQTLKDVSGRDYGSNKAEWTKWYEDSQQKPSTPTEPAKEDTKPASVSPVDSLFPSFTEMLSGSNEVRIKNPNDFSVKVGLRKGSQGKDFDVAKDGTNSVFVPDGSYDIYFIYSNEPTSLYQGDSFTLNGNGVEIQIVKVVNGNYGVRKVK